MAQSLAKNTTHMTIAFTLQKVLSFVFFMYLARKLGTTGSGQYFFALSFTTLFSIAIDLGTSPLLMRDIAQDESKTGKFLSNVYAFKIPLSVIVYAASLFTAWISGYETIIVELVAMAGLVIILDSFTTTNYAVFKGLRELTYEAISAFSLQVVTITIGLGGLYLTGDIRIAMLGVVGGSLFAFIYTLSRVKRFAKIKLEWDWQFIKVIIFMAWPFFLMAMFNRGYNYSDTSILSKMAGTDAVGIYSIPVKLLTAIQFIPATLAAGLYPAMSHAAAHKKEDLGRYFTVGVRYLLTISIPISVGGFVLAHKFIPIVFSSSFEASIIPFKIVMLALPFVFLNYVNGSLLNAVGRHRRNAAHTGFALLLNIILNFLLIPEMGVIGASITAFMTHTFLLGLGFVVSFQTIKIKLLNILIPLVQILASALIMYIVLHLVLNTWSLVPTILIAAVSYVGALFVTRGITMNELKRALALIKN